MKIQILVDNVKSWILPYAQELTVEIKELGHGCLLLHDKNAVTEGDILILLSCESIFKSLSLNKHNLVVHESALPLGRGWSPMTWQVVEGKKKIPVTLFEAAEKVDSGAIYGQVFFEVDKSDLVEDLRLKQALSTKQLIVDFIKNYPVTGRPQTGEPSFYRRRVPEDGQIDPNKTIAEIWPLLQVSDNQRYPAYVVINNQKFYLRVSKE